MADNEIINLEDLHFLGIKVVYKDMVDKGYEILNVRKELDINPQILARKDEQLYAVVVKTGYYPEMGIILPEIIQQVSEMGQKRNAICYYASVGIANANGQTEKEMSRPVNGGEYYINYQGLMPFPEIKPKPQPSDN